MRAPSISGTMVRMAALIDRAALDSATAQGTLGEDGRSGAALERMTLVDGQPVVVKRYDPAADLVMRMIGDDHGREVEIFLSGVLDDLPPTVRHPILGAWYDEDGRGVVVMRDLGDAVLTWDDVLSPARLRFLLEGLADFHAAYRGRVDVLPTDLGDVVRLFEPDRIRPFAGNGLIDVALRGWEYFAEVAPDEVGQRVLALAMDGSPLVRALKGRPPTFLHGDASTVNLALEPGAVTMFDWGVATTGPAEMDVARLLVGSGHILEVTFDEFVAIQREVAGADHDERSLLLSLLAAIAWLGWNKALDIVEHPDEAVRERERQGLNWWLGQARLAFETGDI